MKKGKNIIAGAMLALGAAFSFSEVQAQTCVMPPSCEKLGYSMSVTDCKGYKSLRCPLDVDNDNAVFCFSGSSSSEDDGETCSCPDRYLSTNVCTAVYETTQDNCGNTCYRCWDSKMSAKRYRRCEFEPSGVYRPYEWYEYTCSITGKVYKTLEQGLPSSVDTEEKCLESIKNVNDEPPSEDGYCNRNGEYSAWGLY